MTGATVSDTAQDATASDGTKRGLLWNLVNLAIAAGLALAAFAVYFLPAALGRPLNDTPEARVAVVAREMLQSGNYVLPTLGGEARLKKPPMPYWLAALSSTLFFFGNAGDNPAMARAAMLPPAASAALAVLLVVFFGSRFFNRRAGIMAGLILGSSHLTAYYGHTGYGDTTLMLACAGCVCGMASLLSKKPGLGGALVAGFSLGVGILTKGHIPLVLIAVPLAIEAILRRKNFSGFNAAYIGMAFVIALLVAAPWFVLVNRQHPGAMNAMLAEAGDALVKPRVHEAAAPELEPSTPPGHRQHDDMSYYFYKSACGLLPWTPILLLGLFVWLLSKQNMEPAPEKERGAARFFALYAGIGFLLFLIARKKQEHYLLPLLPALALTAGAQLGRLNAPGNVREERMGWSQLAIGLAGALILACAPAWPAMMGGLHALGIGNAGYLATHAPELSAAIGWFAIPLALGFFAVNFLCARFWATGRGVAAISIFAGLVFAALIFQAVRPAEQDRRSAFWANIEKLKKQTDAAGEGTRFYAAGPGAAQMIFYTGKPVRDLKEIAAASAPASGRSVLIVPAKTTLLFGVDLSSAARTVSDNYALIEMAPDSPLESQLREAIAKKAAEEKR